MSSAAFASSARTTRTRHALGEHDLDGAVVALAPARRRCGRSTRRWVRRCRCGRRSVSACSPRWKPRSFQPIVVGSRAGSRAAHGPGSATASTSSGSTQPVAPPSSETAHRLDLGEGAAYGGLGGAQPPDQVGLGAGTEGAQPRRHERGVPLGLRERGRRLWPSHWDAEVQRGRESFQPPSFSPRRIAPVAASVTITDAATATSAWYFPLPRVTRASSVGSARTDLRGGERAVVLDHPADQREVLLGPGAAVRGDAGGLQLLGQPPELLTGDPGARAAPDRRQQLAGEGEDRTPHRELLDHRPVERTAPGRRRRDVPRPGPTRRGGRRPARWRAGRSSPGWRRGCRRRARPARAGRRARARRSSSPMCRATSLMRHPAHARRQTGDVTTARRRVRGSAGVRRASYHHPGAGRPGAPLVQPPPGRGQRRAGARGGPRRPGAVRARGRPADVAAGARLRRLRRARAGVRPRTRACTGRWPCPCRRW